MKAALDFSTPSLIETTSIENMDKKERMRMLQIPHARNSDAHSVRALVLKHQIAGQGTFSPAVDYVLVDDGHKPGLF